MRPTRSMPADATAEARAFGDAYWAETTPLLRQRFSVAMAIFVFFMGVGTVFEVRYFPQRTSFALPLYGIEAATAIVGAAACWLPPLRRYTSYIVAFVAITLNACICAYHAGVGAGAERVATVLGCVLNMLSVLLPWTWIAQLITATGVTASFAVALPHLATSDAIAIPATVLLAAATTSVCGAFF